MFEKLFMLVKSNAGKAVIDNPMIPATHREAVINDASSSIIEVLKSQMENGKVRELIRFFQFSGIYNQALISSVVNKFANKLNKFYGLEPEPALSTAKALIPPVMQQLIQQTNNDGNEGAISSLLSQLNGNRTDLSGLVHKMMVA